MAAEDDAGEDVRTRRGVSRRVFRVRSLPDTKINAFLTREGDRIPYDTIPAAKTHYNYNRLYKKTGDIKNGSICNSIPTWYNY